MKTLPRWLLALAALLWLAATAGPRAAAPLAAGQQPTFRAGTQVVSLFATVTDRDGRLVPSLEQDDFLVFDDDKPQPLVFFENRSSRLPSS